MRLGLKLRPCLTFGEGSKGLSDEDQRCFDMSGCVPVIFPKMYWVVAAEYGEMCREMVQDPSSCFNVQRL